MDRLGLYNSALLEVGERALATLSDALPSRRYLDQAWDQQAVDKMLSAGQWRFATRVVRIDASTTQQTQFGHPYVFPIPSDHIRTTALTTDEFFNVPLLNFQIDTGYWYASITPIYVMYVSNDANYGANIAGWPANFSEFASLWLATKILAQLTGNKTDVEALEKRRHKALTMAQSTDAMESPVKFPPAGNFVNARQRGRSGSGYDRGPWNMLYGP